MPTRVLAVGISEATPTVIQADDRRTVLIVQNLDTVAGTDFLYLSDERGNVSTTGIRISPVGGSVTLRRSMGEEPEKTFYLVAVTAACPVRVMELYGVPSIIEVRITREPPEQSPQEPNRPTDAPRMLGLKPIPTGYR